MKLFCATAEIQQGTHDTFGFYDMTKPQQNPQGLWESYALYKNHRSGEFSIEKQTTKTECEMNFIRIRLNRSRELMSSFVR